MTRAVVWITEGTWQGCVDAAASLTASDTEFVLLYVIDAEITEALHGAFHGLLGRGGHDPGSTVERLSGTAQRELMAAAEQRLGRSATMETRSGRVNAEVLAACEHADLLVCARDGEHDRLGPRSLGHRTRFVVDHAPCAVLLVWPDQAPGLGSIPPAPPHPPQPPPKP